MCAYYLYQNIEFLAYLICPQRVTLTSKFVIKFLVVKIMNMREGQSIYVILLQHQAMLFDTVMLINRSPGNGICAFSELYFTCAKDMRVCYTVIQIHIIYARIYIFYLIKCILFNKIARWAISKLIKLCTIYLFLVPIYLFIFY